MTLVRIWIHRTEHDRNRDNAFAAGCALGLWLKDEHWSNALALLVVLVIAFAALRWATRRWIEPRLEAWAFRRRASASATRPGGGR